MGCMSSKSQTTRYHQLSDLPRKDPKDFRTESDTKYIGVVGRTGSGLSQFIHDVTGNYQHGVAGEGASERCTRSITPITFQSPQFVGTIVLIDTPGFDYSDRNNEYITFDKLGKWFKVKYGPSTKLDGIIYMHNIWNTEAYHRSPLLTCQLLEDLCGQNWRRKVIFVNSHWGEGITNDGEEREERLRAGYWRFMLSKGSVMRRYESPGNKTQALQILQELIPQSVSHDSPSNPTVGGR